MLALVLLIFWQSPNTLPEVRHEKTQSRVLRNLRDLEKPSPTLTPLSSPSPSRTITLRGKPIVKYVTDEELRRRFQSSNARPTLTPLPNSNKISTTFPAPADDSEIKIVIVVLLVVLGAFGGIIVWGNSGTSTPTYTSRPQVPVQRKDPLGLRPKMEKSDPGDMRKWLP